jgi:ABC-type multidrug transport system ATPase subunit
VLIGQTVRFAVLSQHLDELTALGDDRVRQVISRYNSRVMLDGKEQSPSQLLEKLGFGKADLNEPVCDLSGGQKRRLALMLILLDEPNVLILDEPGNDLDTDMMAAVENLLDGWPGTLVLVTHDRYMMERVTDNQFALIDGHLRHLPGGIEEYLRLTADTDDALQVTATRQKGAPHPSEHSAFLTNNEAAQNGEGVTGGSAGVVNTPVAQSAEGAAAGVDATCALKPKLSGGQARELRKKMATNEKKTATLRSKIEAKKAEMQECRPTDYKSLTALQEEIAQFQAQIDQLELEWLEVAEILGE